MKNVLVLCTGNSCRSQMAHGFLKKYLVEKAHIYSAGVETHGINPDAAAAMQRVGIDISHHTSNLFSEYAHIDFDYVITVCDHARESCPLFPTQALKLHHNFPDPSKYTGSSEEKLAEFDRVRDLIDTYCKDFVNTYF